MGLSAESTKSHPAAGVYVSDLTRRRSDATKEGEWRRRFSCAGAPSREISSTSGGNSRHPDFRIVATTICLLSLFVLQVFAIGPSH